MSNTVLAPVDGSNVMSAWGPMVGPIGSAKDTVPSPNQPTPSTAPAAKSPGSCCPQRLQNTAATISSCQSFKAGEQKGCCGDAKKVDQAIVSPLITNSMIAQPKGCCTSKSVVQGASSFVQPVEEVGCCFGLSNPINKDVLSRVELAKMEGHCGSSPPANRAVASPIWTAPIAKEYCGVSELANREAVLSPEPVATPKQCCNSSKSKQAVNEIASPSAEGESCCEPSEASEQAIEVYIPQSAVKREACCDMEESCDTTAFDSAANMPVNTKGGCRNDRSLDTSAHVLSIKSDGRRSMEHDPKLGKYQFQIELILVAA